MQKESEKWYQGKPMCVCVCVCVCWVSVWVWVWCDVVVWCGGGDVCACCVLIAYKNIYNIC